MKGDAFHIAFALLFVSGLAVRWGYHFRSNILFRFPWTVLEGRMLNIIKMIMTGAFIVVCFGYIADPDLITWSLIESPRWLRWLGALMAFVSIPSYLWCFAELQSQYSSTLILQSDHKLITTGPYRWIRHPMYSVGLVGSLGLSMLASNWLMGIFGLIVAYLVMGIRAGREEKMMIEKFGKEYENYTERTGKFFPRLTRWF